MTKTKIRSIPRWKRGEMLKKIEMLKNFHKPGQKMSMAQRLAKLDAILFDKVGTK